MRTWIEASSNLIQEPRFAAAFLDLLLKSSVVLASAGALCVCWRRASAASRHMAWFMAVVSLLFLPLFSFTLPAWRQPLWTVATGADSGNHFTLGIDFAPLPAFNSGIPAPTVPISSLGNVKAGGGQRLGARLRTSWLAPAFALWCAGVMVIGCSIIIGWSRLGRLRRRSGAPRTADWTELLRELGRELNLGRPVRLLQSGDDVMPVTWGWWRPVILLPAEADGWPAERRRVVLLHELAHVKRWDCLTQAVTRMVCAFYWFNPLVWLAGRRMCIERERACDDLVLNSGCKASDYAGHLLDIARSFRRVPQVAAIAMARSSRLASRIAAIIDSSRARRAPPAFLLGALCLGVLGLVAAIAAQKPKADALPASAAAGGLPWFDTRLRAFFTVKALQAHQLALKENQTIDPEISSYFDAGKAGDWRKVEEGWLAMRAKLDRTEGAAPGRLCTTVAWQPVLETYLAWQEFAGWKEKYVMIYGQDIMKSIPPGSIYFGGTDPGRGVVTAMSESHSEAKPFFTLTQNALADGAYLRYLREMYGSRIYTPTELDLTNAYDRYSQDLQRRQKENKLLPGEDVKIVDGRVRSTGQIGVIAIYGMLAELLFDKNPDREFYLEQSFALEWMYPHLSPNGLVLKINRQPLSELSEEAVRQDHTYWRHYLQPMIGDWLDYDTPLAEVAAFAERVYLKRDLSAFKGDPQFIEDAKAQAAFSKLRSSIGGLYAWRLSSAKAAAEKDRMAKEADFAFRQAFALCPKSPEAVFRYVSLLFQQHRLDDALLVAKTSLKIEPTTGQMQNLVQNLEQFRAQAQKQNSSSSK